MEHWNKRWKALNGFNFSVQDWPFNLEHILNKTPFKNFFTPNYLIPFIFPVPGCISATRNQFPALKDPALHGFSPIDGTDATVDPS